MMLQDCFFVSVVIRNNHNMKDKPVAVCHSDSPKGTAEISSANYPARAYGWFYQVLSISVTCATYFRVHMCKFCL